MSALLAVLVLTAAISMVMVVLGVLADWVWPLLENRLHRPQATRRPS